MAVGLASSVMVCIGSRAISIGRPLCVTGRGRCQARVRRTLSPGHIRGRPWPSPASRGKGRKTARRRFRTETLPKKRFTLPIRPFSDTRTRRSDDGKGNDILEDPTRSSFPQKRESRGWIPASAGAPPRRPAPSLVAPAPLLVTPAKAGVQGKGVLRIPAFAGMTRGAGMTKGAGWGRGDKGE